MGTSVGPIAHVAIRFRGRVWSLPAPNRHHNVIALIAQETGVEHVDSRGEDQGFIAESGEYLTRRQALRVARRHRQLRPDRVVHCNELYSENAW